MKDISLWAEADWIAAIASAVLILFLAAGAWAVTRPRPEVANHPKGLYILFFAEMWERFSYYGMRALLIFYLTQHWLFSDSRSNLIYGAYVSLVYITPVLGGYLADRYLGQRKAVLFGGVLLAIGHGLMAVEGNGGQSDATINFFWLALSFIIVGSGFLKANISVIVGQLYPRTDIRRDGAYTIFYIGINVGAALGVLLAGYLGQTVGWSYGFGAAGIGMLLGLIVFVIGKPLLLGQGEPPEPAALAKSVGGIKLEWLLYLIGILAVGFMWVLIQFQSVVGGLMAVFGLALLAYVLFEAFKQDKHARDRLFAIIFLLLLQPVFWGLFEQAGGSLNLFTDRYVDRQGVPASLFQSINSIFIITLGPIFAALWVFLAKRGWEPSTPFKFGLALLQVGLGFLVFVWGANAAGPTALVPVILVFAIYFLHTSGELCLSPVGLSAMNRLSPVHLASLIMGAWFFATAGGNYVAGLIGAATGGEEGEMSRELTLSVYNSIGWFGIAVGVGVLVLSPFVKKLMHLDTLRDDNVDDDLLGQSEAGLEAQEAGVHPDTKR
ncbi:peptide MFS transporter [Altericroceibacterium endophyticum]|uniref:MFS transporter n=1 Tax=Altericroceibacterium endophyticum TaxID=1808508 RepID=A0A6I4T5X2_9SPHN|nr:peptide MFS transporter [Altericroceibacterium endophyticum]MXO65531.1 MFS transporter [Altericroceibacterium endophyticum]